MEIEQFFYTATELSAMAESAQDASQSEAWRKLQLIAVRKSYLEWYRKCLMLLSDKADAETKQRFVKLYQGKWYRFGIASFLRLGHKQHGLNGWMTRFDSVFERNIEEQCNILAEVTN